MKTVRRSAAVLLTLLLSTPSDAARTIVTDPNFVADDTWLKVEVRLEPFWFNRTSNIPDYAAVRFEDEPDFTVLPTALPDFWLPIERPQFLLQILPSGDLWWGGDTFRLTLAPEIALQADRVTMLNSGSGTATGFPVHFFLNWIYRDGERIDFRQVLTRPTIVPEPSALALAALVVPAVSWVRRKRLGLPCDVQTTR